MLLFTKPIIPAFVTKKDKIEIVWYSAQTKFTLTRIDEYLIDCHSYALSGNPWSHKTIPIVSIHPALNKSIPHAQNLRFQLFGLHGIRVIEDIVHILFDV